MEPKSVLKFSSVVKTIDVANPSCAVKVGKAHQRWAMESGVILNTPQYCELCLCVCMDPMSDEGRWNFDLSSLTADTANGYVVTGLRFERRNKTAVLNVCVSLI